MPDSQDRRYLVILMLGDANIQRLAALVPWFQRSLNAIADGRIQLAFNSAARDEFGYFLRSRMKAHQMIERLRSPGGIRQEPLEVSMLTNTDDILVLEIGEDFSGSGRSRAWAWLQHH